MVVTRFKPPAPKRLIHQQVPERLRRVQNACAKIYQSYVYNKTTDRQELEFSLYAQKFPENVRTRLLTLARARLMSSKQFEINEAGDLQKDFGVRECLVYKLHQECMDPRNQETNILSYCTARIGVYAAPLGIINYDDLGNAIGSTVSGWINRFWIPFTRETVESVIAEHGGHYKNLVLGKAREAGDSWYGSISYTVKNLEEFIAAPFEDLLAANRGSFLKEEYGGVIRYQKHRDQERKKREAEIADFQNAQNNNSSKSKAVRNDEVKNQQR